ncbi:MAG: LytTR family transcriptional regulator DNA-binding domain-containing protein [Lachnospiraceae bacterium]|nr:LytTR family transcriptional regulator DNA-binding domain-containing protein [Lachnospiraceae bacterium]
MKLCRIGICEDDELYRNYLTKIIRKCVLTEDKVGIFFYSDGSSLFSASNRKELDILFMDVQLPDGDGNAFMERFRKENTKALVSFCTNMGTPAADTFKMNIYRYIRKDEGKEKVEKQVAEVIEEYMRRCQYQEFHAGPDKIYLEVPDIMYCEKQKRGTLIHMDGNREVLVSEHLSDIYESIHPHGFACPHGSYIVNMEYITGVNKRMLRLTDDEELGIAPRKWKQFQEDFRNFIE